MIELFIFYIVFSYLYMLGFLADYYNGKKKANGHVASALLFLLAPLAMPFLMGMNQ